MFIEPEDLEITFAAVYNRVVRMYLTDKYKNLFSKRKVKEMVGEVREAAEPMNYKSNDGRLEELILRQDEIKRALAEIRKNKK